MKLGSKELPHSTAFLAPAPTAASALQPRQVFRSEIRWGHLVIEWPSVGAVLATLEIRDGVHSVPNCEFARQQINYEFLLNARPGRVLLCHFHGAEKQDGEGGDYIASTFSQNISATKM